MEVRKHMRKRITLLIMAAMLALTMAFGGVATAKIEPVCQNPGGGEPQGKCQGQSLTEENRNPAGKAPRGQN
jgi:hypothetical protein